MFTFEICLQTCVDMWLYPLSKFTNIKPLCIYFDCIYLWIVICCSVPGNRTSPYIWPVCVLCAVLSLIPKSRDEIINLILTNIIQWVSYRNTHWWSNGDFHEYRHICIFMIIDKNKFQYLFNNYILSSGTQKLSLSQNSLIFLLSYYFYTLCSTFNFFFFFVSTIIIIHFSILLHVFSFLWGSTPF